MGKFLVLFLAVYLGMYFYKKWKYKKKNSVGQIRYYEQELSKRDYEEGDIIDVDTDEDDTQPPKYLH
ncbi:MAG: hypothetical protein GWM89_01220 [Candidatus Dadabacteria bacterium]|nr:hypothetical protein [Candidatus Dadabacteria bacterium]NIV41393.1 hypothetical protein [Candidatus Dadabacteria bacterium]NIX14600.1 hypothetical protein [Candidatus Dadabacteria bacterium]NIY21055.1 hypothetical protein [Candidatus Dadabacteria bacterium]